MNSEQAKQLSIPDLMGMWGYEPVKILKNGNSLWYTSPFRKEKDPSFVTTYTGGKCKWIWKDFGDSGGTIIDLVERYQSLGISASLAYLERMFGKQTSKNNRVGDRQTSLFSFKQQSNLSAKPTDQNFSSQELELKLLNVKPVTSPIIFSYLTKERCIDRKLIDKYLVEVSYDNLAMKKRFFAFGIKNDSEGYEIRSASDKYKFKSSLNAKDITTIKGTGAKPTKINIFEGMTDFLSLLTWFKRDILPSTSIIMNSTNANLDKTISALKMGNYNKINTFFDNDSTGIKTFEAIKAEFPDNTFSQSSLFASHTDFNDMLKANCLKIKGR
ncbi:MAG: toprim domain-containing protein [Saprospiraceae bacterium]